MKMMDVSPPTTDGKTTGRRRPLHEGAGTVGEQDASSDILTADSEAELSPPPPTASVGLSAKVASVKNNSDDFQRTRKRHHTSSTTTTTRNQKGATASATAGTVARAALRNSSVHSSNSSSGSGGDNGNTSNTTTGASVKFAMPPKVVAGGSATGSSLSLSSDADSNSKKVSALKQQQQQQHAAGASVKVEGTKPPPSSHTLASNNDSSRSKSSSGSGSGSGSDGNEGGATSSSNPAVVTQSTYNPNATSSGSGGGDTRSTSGSGSGSDGGMGGNNRRNGEETTASNEYYFAGYGSGSLAGRASTSGNSGQGGPTEDAATSPQAPQANAAAPMPASGEMTSFASFRGATLAASANAAAAGMHPQGNNESNLSSRHVAVATDGASGLPPPAPQQAHECHLRHHLRYHHHHRHDLQALPLPHGGVAASRPVLPPAGALEGIPSAIGGPPRSLPQPHQHYELRLPPSDEQAVLQRVPRAHATVVAHDLPPPPTSSDAWSSTSGSRSSSKHRKLTVASASATAGQPFSVASAGMADGKTMGTVNETSRTSPTSSVAGENTAKPQAMHVSTDDPILRKKMSLKDEANPAMNKALCPNLKRKAGSLAREASDDSSDGVKSESEERSGSEEGYEGASSSNDNRPSSGSGSDSVSSDDAKKVATARNPPSNPSEVRMGSQSNSKRTETSSMSSSVLADFSSVVNEETRAMNSGSSSPRSESSSLTSTGNEAQAKTMLTPTVGAVNLSEKPTATQASSASIGSKRNAFHLKSPAEGNKRSKPSSPVSIELPSAANNTMNSGLAIIEKTLQSKVRSAHHHHYHNRRNVGRKLLQQSYLSAQRDLSDGPSGVQLKDAAMTDAVNSSLFEEATIYSLGHDAMANIASFLEPQETHSFLTTPFSKTWLETYTAPQELWKILCTSKPFFAILPNNRESGDDASTSSYPLCNDLQMKHLFGRYRLLYSSFVRCMKYLNRLQDDALNGREPSITMKSNPNDMYPFNNNVSLKAYFAKARRIVRSRRGGTGSESGSQESLTSDSTNEKKRKRQSSGGSGPRLGNSMITNRLLRPTATGEVDNVNLPWSCAIYSVVNWMVAFQDVEGIQIMCLKCLPYLLEDEQQRTTAQRAGLTDNVLRAMVLFPDSIELHTVAFHTLVLLARPLGGNEGMLFHTAMVNTRGIFNNGSSSSKNGIVIMLDSMRRFAQDEILQAMSCWSLVNVALTPLQKSMLVKLGGLTVTANAMLQHPYNVEVQFRALFALINLVIPTEPRGPEETEQMREIEREIFQQLGEAGETTEREMLDASVGQITNLVVVAMKNFCSSEAILNRACLVLHNLSLNEEYHGTLLWTPNCYQMLEWCIGNYPHDHVLQQSAGGTLNRLNATLSANEELRVRFTHSIRAQNQYSLEVARQEAVQLQELHLEQQRLQNIDST
jgi:hypothetical protein